MSRGENALLWRKGTTRSSGQEEARGYVIATVPEQGIASMGPAERVILSDPRRTPTLPVIDGLCGSAPRSPDQATWTPSEGTGIELPDGRPMTEAQRVFVDPELIAQWESDAQRKKAG
jgi:hypothetical protein